jgi:prenyltransferase beta subunit
VVAAADCGLAWLAAAQKADGSYGRTGGYSSHAGFTALAGLAFLSNGSVPGRGKYCKNVERCLNYLLAHTGRSGLIVGGGVETGPMYGHGFATLFLAEVYGQSPRDDVREKLTRAVNLIVATQNDQGGWRYQPIKMDADLSVTICQIMALRAARNNGIKVPKSTIDKAIDYVKKSQNADGGFSYVLGFGQDSAFPRSAAGVCSLFNCGIYAGPEIDRGLKYIMKFKPGRKQAAQEFVGHYFYGNYYAAQATFIAGGDYWRQWWPAISGELLAKQTRDGSWAGEAGAEYATAMACIILQIPNRYLPILQR